MSDLSAWALDKIEDTIAYLWHSDAPDKFEKVVNIFSLLIPMFPLLFISHCLRDLTVDSRCRYSSQHLHLVASEPISREQHHQPNHLLALLLQTLIPHQDTLQSIVELLQRDTSIHRRGDHGAVDPSNLTGLDGVMGVEWELGLEKLLRGVGQFWRVVIGWTFLLISFNLMAGEGTADL